MTTGGLFSKDKLCPFTHRILITCNEFNINIPVFYGDDIPSQIQDDNKGGTWPVFQPPGSTGLLKDSAVIVEYILDNSDADTSQYISDNKLIELLDEFVLNISKIIRAGHLGVQMGCRKKVDKSLQEIQKILKTSGGPFLGGEKFTQADGHITPFLYRLPFFKEFRNHIPPLLLENEDIIKWVDNCTKYQSFRKIAPARNLLRAFYAKMAQIGKPMKIGQLHHSGFRNMLSKIQKRAEVFSKPTDPGNDYLKKTRDLCYILFRAIILHAKFENLLLYPAMEIANVNPDLTLEAEKQHHHECEQMNLLLAKFDQVISLQKDDRKSELVKLAGMCVTIKKAFIEHLEFEEKHFMPILSGLELPEHKKLLDGAYEMCKVERPYLIGILTAFINSVDIISLIDSLLIAVTPDSDDWYALIQVIHKSVDENQWNAITRRYEDIIPTSLLIAPVSQWHMDYSAWAVALDKNLPIQKLEIPSCKSI
jgi:glutathione S-transferase